MTQPLVDLVLVQKTAIAATEPKTLAPDELVAFVIPEDAKLETVNLHERLDRYAAAPTRATGTHSAATVKSFIDIAARHKDTLATTVWVHPVTGDIVAVLNDHGDAQAPGWGDHRVHLKLTATEEWKRWTALDGQFLDQQKFAEHIQDGLTEIAEPPAADLLEVVQTMQGSSNASWANGVNLVNGAVTMQYVENVDAMAGREGKLTVPTDFSLVMAPFIGEDSVQIDAKLRWRMHGGKLSIGYKLDNPGRVVREVLERIAVRLDEHFDNVYLGQPSQAR